MSCADDMAFGPTGPEKLFQSGLDLRLIAQNLHAERALEVAMRMPNPLGIGQCLWGTAFTNPGRGCRKPKGHMDAHDLYGQSGIPANLKTREEQEAWAIANGFDEILMKTKNRFYDMRATLAQLHFNVIRFVPNPVDNRESKVFLSKRLGQHVLDTHRSRRSVTKAGH